MKNGKSILSVSIKHLCDTDPDTSYLGEYGNCPEESLNNGNWGYIGIRAESEVQLEKNGPVQTITSGGLWGIESDFGKEYFTEVESEELSQLRKELKSIGFSARALSKAFSNVEHVNE